MHKVVWIHVFDISNTGLRKAIIVTGFSWKKGRREFREDKCVLLRWLFGSTCNWLWAREHYLPANIAILFSCMKPTRSCTGMFCSCLLWGGHTTKLAAAAGDQMLPDEFHTGLNLKDIVGGAKRVGHGHVRKGSMLVRKNPFWACLMNDFSLVGGCPHNLVSNDLFMFR